MHDAASELATAGAVLVHQRFALIEGKREPVGVAGAPLRHRVEAPRRHVMRGRRDGRIQPCVEHLLWHASGVVADLSDADIAVDDLKTGALQIGLQLAQLAPVGVHRHECDVALVAEHRNRHHLHASALSRLHARDDGFAINQRRWLAEQVQDTTPDGRADRFAHAFRLGAFTPSARARRRSGDRHARNRPTPDRRDARCARPRQLVR